MLDYVVKSKCCIVCLRQSLDPESPKYAEWYETHRAFCHLNHSGSSPSMECEGAVEIFSRLQEKLQLRYDLKY